jgi:hypothetical protein
MESNSDAAGEASGVCVVVCLPSWLVGHEVFFIFEV